MVDFHSTMMGRKYYERDVPQLIKQLQIIGKEMVRTNNLEEQLKTNSIEHPFTVEQLESLAKVIKESRAYFLIDDIQKRNYKASQILDELLKD